MAKYKGIVTTDAGLELLAKACSGGSVKFTAVKTGDGVYDGTEDLSGMTALKSVKQSFGLSGVSRIGTQVRVRSVLSNEGLTTGYNITEIGLYAMDPDTGSEFLYAIIVAEAGYEDYLPPHSDSPSSITLEIYLTLTETENDVKFTAEVVAGTYASAEAFQEFVDNVINGATQVGNAKNLDGHGAEYFAKETDLASYLPKNTVRLGEIGFDDTTGLYIRIDGSVIKIPYGLAPQDLFLKSGGTVTAQHYLPLVLKNANGNNSYIQFEGKDGVLGYIGFESTNVLRLLSSVGGFLGDILHTGNKPTGTYTGNGDATIRYIETGGIGNTLLVRCDTYTSILTAGISFSIKNDGTIQALNGMTCWFQNGVAAINTVNEALNASGVVYTYDVL